MAQAPESPAKSKRPSMQFYPGDWQRDAALRSCSVPARGLWLEMICVMHQAEPYGHLVVNGKAVATDTLARMVGCTPAECKRWQRELEDAGVFSRIDGVVVSRRMVRDEEIRKGRAEGGKLGGNPNLVGNPKDGNKVVGKVNHPPNHPPTPSVAVAVSSSSSPSGKPPGSESGGDATTGAADPPWLRKALTPDLSSMKSRRIPEDWEPDELTVRWVSDARPDLVAHLPGIVANFREYWQTRTGHHAESNDWGITFRRWIRNERDRTDARSKPIDWDKVFGEQAEGAA